MPNPLASRNRQKTGSVRKWGSWALVSFVPFVLLPFLSTSCADREGYPEDLDYPARTDLIVDETPKLSPNNLSAPGAFEKSIADLALVGGKILDPAANQDPWRAELNELLKEHFGTPAFPRVGASKDGLESAANALNLDPKTLELGSMAYRRHCLQCHGLAGDGRGASGIWVHPAPRDFRQGKFKFLSTSTARNLNRPSRDDLVRTFKVGVHGTSMPAFGLLAEEELQAIASYVIHLSIRGEMEFTILRTLLKPKSQIVFLFENFLPDEEVSKDQEKLSVFVPKYLKEILSQYALAEKSILQAPEYPYKDEDLPESIKRGHRLFSSQAPDALGCVSCHVDYGRSSPWQYDEWGSVSRPSNLTSGIFKGGRRPIDLYWRMKRGIPPSKMPAVTITGGDEDKKIWDLINFIENAPYPAKLPPEVREAIYGKSGRLAPAASSEKPKHQ